MAGRLWINSKTALGALTTLALVLHQGPAASASSDEIASRHFDRGLEFVDQRDFSKAVLEFEQAYEHSGHYAVLYNLGLAYATVGRYREARETLTRYLTQGQSELAAERRAAVSVLLQKYAEQLVWVTITVTPTSAKLWLDGDPVTDSHAGIQLDPGNYVFTARATGYADKTISVELGAGEHQTLSLALQLDQSPSGVGSPIHTGRPDVDAAPAPSTPQRGAARRPSRNLDQNASVTPPSPDRTYAYWLGGAGLAVGGAATLVWLVNDRRFDDWERNQAALPAPGTPLDTEQQARQTTNNELKNSITTWDRVVVSLGVSAGIALSGAVVLWVTAEPDAPDNDVSLSLQADRLVVSGRF